jgi:hypothetical protein
MSDNQITLFETEFGVDSACSRAQKVFADEFGVLFDEFYSDIHDHS